ncbi:tRNA(Met) cytidine acetyltransferase TmcA [Halorientalis pallida]|nr:tRNA(Met) cytidine acetyltransferase TmcA [Halorientalis pallida]
MLDGVVGPLRDEARETDERRLLVLAGDPDRTRRAAGDALDAAAIDRSDATLVGPEPALDCEHLPPERSADLLGTTREAVVLDMHAACRPNTIGRAVGVVDGGGLLVLLTPSLDTWPDRRDGFDEGLAVPPADLSAVTGRFRRRLVETLRTHPGIAVVDADAHRVERDGLTDPPPVVAGGGVSLPDARTFPDAVYEACLTDDQADAVLELERLREAGQAVVIEADRGRGKSSAAGLSAGALALAGEDVLVAAPAYRNAAEVLERARERLTAADALASVDDPDTPHELTAPDGSVRFRRAADAADGPGLPGDPDAVIVDEAAALPVHVLDSFLDAPAVAFATTVHGYEGAGRGFSVRFRDHLDQTDHDVGEIRMTEPIRYAAGDPVEVWAFRALLLDASPPVEPLVADAQTETVEYVTLDAADLVADETLLREAFGLLVLAHYRTEPDDLARLLDAPNVAVRALLHDGHVVSVALLAREGGLDDETRANMYDGARIRGNMLPDVLTTQLRDESAGVPVGYRVLRIATHHTARSRGLGSRLLTEVRAEFATDVDWLGVGYGATPELLAFWAANGYAPVHLSTTRNDESGEYSALMLDPTSDAGADLFARHADQFVARVGDVLADPLTDLDPDVARATLSALHRDADPELADWEWRQVASAAFGPGLFDMAPGLYRRLAVTYFTADVDLTLTPRQERLLVLKPLQGRPWDAVAATLDYHSTAEAMRALGDALEPLVDEFGPDAALTEADRYR